MSNAFLWVIGSYNVLGGLFTLGFLSEAFGNRVFGKVMEICAEPYTHGRYGPIWIWWAAIATTFLGAVMLLATRWETTARKDVTLAVVVAYGVMLLPVLGALRSPRYRRSGLYAVLVLWPGQMAWGLWYYCKQG